MRLDAAVHLVYYSNWSIGWTAETLASAVSVWENWVGAVVVYGDDDA